MLWPALISKRYSISILQTSVGAVAYFKNQQLPFLSMLLTLLQILCGWSKHARSLQSCREASHWSVALINPLPFIFIAWWAANRSSCRAAPSWDARWYRTWVHILDHAGSCLWLGQCNTRSWAAYDFSYVWQGEAGPVSQWCKLEQDAVNISQLTLLMYRLMEG